MAYQYSKRDKSMVSNYPPVSLTSVVEKLFESIIAKNIHENFHKYNLINDFKNGFIK